MEVYVDNLAYDKMSSQVIEAKREFLINGSEL